MSGLIAGARQTMYFSNIGRITMPKALAPYVCQFDFFIGCAGRQICMCSYEDHMMVTCAGSSSPKDTERAFFRRLAEFDSDMILIKSEKRFDVRNAVLHFLESVYIVRCVKSEL